MDPHGAHESPSRTDPVVAVMSAVVGGPLGEHAAGHRWWNASRVLLGATGVVLAAGMVSKAACVPSAWGKDRQPFTELCWTDLAGTSVDAGSPPHVTSWLARLAGLLPGSGTVATTAALAVLLAALALVATALLVRVDVRRPWAAAGWAMSPVLLVHWLSWELIAAVGVAVLLWGWTTGRAWLAGVGAGIAGAFVLPVAAAFVGVIAVGGRPRDRVDALLAAAAAHVLITLPGRARLDAPDIGSIWLLLQQGGVGGARTTRWAVQLVVLALAAAAVVWLVRRSGGTGARTVASAGLVMVAAALVVAPSAPPEHALVVLPLAAIALRRWRDLLVWQGLHLLGWVITGWYVGESLVPTITDDARAYWLAILLRVIGLAWLVWAVLRDAGSGDHDVVEVGRGEADPDVNLLPDAGHARA
ncbi:Uncharacterized membrane protein [Nocardioides alpinus]|uniref:Uncharacterized membrane protein n=1 Tax=Nocardioides alpinus TaxID=748909 RepID=A0A1I0ZY83_9ACTN|nr:hypothetical protein [Nocardioides alpinus]PKH42251.1 hypothetical protein CXG46_07230 [Nocardioides alpinus]SFB30689.1 Uncharacterized membrane protein [Nocardioides alpinus]